MNRLSRVIRSKWIALSTTAVLMQLIPFDCLGQNILRLVTPVYLDDTHNLLERIVTFVAPLVLP